MRDEVPDQPDNGEDKADLPDHQVIDSNFCDFCTPSMCDFCEVSTPMIGRVSIRLKHGF